MTARDADARPVEDYALIGDTQTAALISRDGSIDWLCFPRFDSGACFARLVGTRGNGHWQIQPTDVVRATSRRYVGDSLVLETTFETDTGVVQVIDFMPVRGEAPDVVRIVVGISGRVPMRMDLVVRFDYGFSVPWVRREPDDRLSFIAGPDALSFRAPVTTRGEDLATVADFEVEAGDRLPMVLSWHASHLPPPHLVDAEVALEGTLAWWEEWIVACRVTGPWAPMVRRSLLTLKALTYAPTGGIIAAPTTSLPEDLGGVRNWDYRYCWLRDATFTLQALLAAGYEAEAMAWRDWLLRATAGAPSQLQIMYGVAGERRLPEMELPWLVGYESSAPVRVGNAAAGQRQLDVYGEVVDALHQSRQAGIPPDERAWAFEVKLLEYLEDQWREPDAGLWEVRGPERHFTHSKVLCWVAFDRAVRTIEHTGAAGDVERWRQVRDEIHAEVCAQGFDPERGTFTQYYGSGSLDASLLMIPLVGFLPPDDPRVVGTVEAVQRELCRDGLVMRYPTQTGVDGVQGDEGAFLACSFWLADALALIGRGDEAAALFARLCALANDVGLLAEEYDPALGRMVGNFPQAFSHVGLVNTALNLTRSDGPAATRKASGS
jgi:GH15 family glucan-1,4-alpha-glucosidase